MSVTPRLTGVVSEPIRERPQILSEVELLRRDLGIEMDENDRLTARNAKLKRRLDEALALVAKRDAEIQQLRLTKSMPSLPGFGPRHPIRVKRQYRVGRLVIDMAMRLLKFNGRSLPLTPKEALMLAHLAERRDTIVTTPVLGVVTGGTQTGACIRKFKMRIDAKLAQLGAVGYLNSRCTSGGGYWLTNPEVPS